MPHIVEVGGLRVDWNVAAPPSRAAASLFASLPSTWQLRPHLAVRWWQQFHGSHLCRTVSRGNSLKRFPHTLGRFSQKPQEVLQPHTSVAFGGSRAFSSVNPRQRDGVTLTGLVQRQPTLEREPVAQGRGWNGLEEATAVVATNCLFGLLGGAGTFSVVVIVGLVLRVLCVMSCDSRGHQPESHTWIASIAHCAYLLSKEKKNSFSHIIPESANFVLNEFFGFKSRLIIISLLVITR